MEKSECVSAKYLGCEVSVSVMAGRPEHPKQMEGIDLVEVSRMVVKQ